MGWTSCVIDYHYSQDLSCPYGLCSSWFFIYVKVVGGSQPRVGCGVGRCIRFWNQMCKQPFLSWPPSILSMAETKGASESEWYARFLCSLVGWSPGLDERLFAAARTDNEGLLLEVFRSEGKFDINAKDGWASITTSLMELWFDKNP